MTRLRTLVAEAACLALPVLALPAFAPAQVPGARLCGPDVFNERKPAANAGPVERMHPLVSRARHADAVRNEQWELALRGLRSEALEAFVAGQVAAEHQSLFLAQLDIVIDQLPRLPRAGDPQRRAFIASLQPARFRPLMAVDAYQIFPRERPPIDVGALGDAQARALCWSAMSVDLVLFRLAQPLDLGALARLARLTTAWSNYRTYGYTRQPLELFVRPGSVHDTLPPIGQLVLGHLSLGQEMRGTSLDSLVGSTATVVEVGHLWYRSNYTQYSGVSMIVSVASNRTVGIGPLVHLARSLRGGAIFRREDGVTRTSFLISTDLYGLLQHSKRAVEEGLAIAQGIVVLPTP